MAGVAVALLLLAEEHVECYRLSLEGSEVSDGQEGVKQKKQKKKRELWWLA